MGNRGLSRSLGLGNRNKEFQSIVPFPANEAIQEEKIDHGRKRKVAEVGRIDDDQVKDGKYPAVALTVHRCRGTDDGLYLVDVCFDTVKPAPLPKTAITQEFRETEGKMRRDNLANHETECSQISKFIFVSGMKVAADYELLAERGIKRIVNCAPMVCPNFHEDKGAFKYLSVNLVDGRVEDISWFVCQVIQFVKEGVLKGERVLIHCEKGVSRSCSMAIAHRMWQTGM